MADIMTAYKILNKSLGLKLTTLQMARCEQMAKVVFAKDQGFQMTETDALNFTAHVHFKPRKGMAIKAVSVAATPRKKAT